MTNMTQAALNEIHELTDANYHTMALCRLAKALGEEFLVDQLNILDFQHREAGSMTEEIAQKRRDYSSWLMGKAAEVVDNFADIEAAF